VVNEEVAVELDSLAGEGSGRVHASGHLRQVASTAFEVVEDPSPDRESIHIDRSGRSHEPHEGGKCVDVVASVLGVVVATVVGRALPRRAGALLG
jgi:hypothetical protein